MLARKEHTPAKGNTHAAYRLSACAVALKIRWRSTDGPKRAVRKTTASLWRHQARAFMHPLNYDIIPCKASDYVLQKRLSGLGNLI